MCTIIGRAVALDRLRGMRAGGRGCLRAALVRNARCRLVEDLRILAWVERKAVLEVAQLECSARRIECELELAALQRDAVVVAQDRNQHPVGEIRGGRVPVDVEELCVLR